VMIFAVAANLLVFHPIDEDLSLPPQEAKTATWGPGRWGLRS